MLCASRLSVNELLAQVIVPSSLMFLLPEVTYFFTLNTVSFLKLNDWLTEFLFWLITTTTFWSFPLKATRNTFVLADKWHQPDNNRVARISKTDP